MSFFEFIVSNKKVSQEGLLQALLYQQKMSPSMLECLAGHGKINITQLLELLVRAQREQLDLVSMQEKSQIIDKIVFSEALKKFKDSLIPLGKICAELGIFSIDEYEELLEEFQRFSEDKQSHESQTEVSVVTPAGPEISEAALESLRELGIVDDSLVSEEKKSL